MGDEVRVTVIATGFDRARRAAGCGIRRLLARSGSAARPRRPPWRPTMPELDVPGDALEIPSFLREE